MSGGRGAAAGTHGVAYRGAMEPVCASVRLYGDLAGLAWDTEATGETQVIAAAPRSVKDARSAVGVDADAAPDRSAG